jgi:protein involved in polysaccharide export with SLBB domain
VAKGLRDATGPPSVIPRELDKRVGPPYVIEPGDGLLVQPASLDSPVRLPGDQTVLSDGTISLGSYGQMLVAGKTLVQIEAEVNALIGGTVKDAGKIVVRLVTRDSKVYYVLGEVNSPGAFAWRGRETVLDAILAAGGLTTNASRNNIILTRPTPPDSCRVVLPVCYTDIVQVGDTKTNYQVCAGDRIYVPSRTFREQLCPKKASCSRCSDPHTPCPLHEPAPGELGLEGMPVGLPAPQTIWRPVEVPKPQPDRGDGWKAGPPDREGAGKSESRSSAGEQLPRPRETP